MPIWSPRNRAAVAKSDMSTQSCAPLSLDAVRMGGAVKRCRPVFVGLLLLRAFMAAAYHVCHWGGITLQRFSATDEKFFLMAPS